MTPAAMIVTRRFTMRRILAVQLFQANRASQRSSPWLPSKGDTKSYTKVFLVLFFRVLAPSHRKLPNSSFPL